MVAYGSMGPRALVRLSTASSSPTFGRRAHGTVLKFTLGQMWGGAGAPVDLIEG